MRPLFDLRANATRQKAADGDTLAKIAKAAGLPDWKALALFNWGTDDVDEVRRLLFETVGWEKADDDPGKTVLKPHPDADRELLVPKLWPAPELELDQVHEIRVKPVPDPPVAVHIDHLDRWFIPGRERCDLRYSLQGLSRCAARVDFEVFGSRYGAAGDWNNGFVHFGAADLTDTALYTSEEQANAPERAKAVDVTEWRGEVTATAGALGKKNPGGEDRVINVAFSPYTVLLRYFADEADRKARLDIDAFWPVFAADGTATADSLKLRWAVRFSDRCQSTQGGGTLIVVDGSDQVVFRAPLKLADLAGMDSGFRELAWDGKYSAETKTNSAGGDKVIAADMPYRLQVQAHTGPGEAKGLALAAMHTEVRLYVRPGTHLPSLDPYVAETDQPSMVLRCDRELLVTEAKARGAGKVWIQQELARAGYHPGPVDGSDRPSYAAALREFKRSVPKRKRRPRDDFERLVIDASEGGDVLDAIEDLAAQPGRQRPWFGDPAAARANLGWEAGVVTPRLSDPAGELIVWVDDRHYYTDAGWLNGCGPRGIAARTKTIAAHPAMGNYALAYTSGDAVIDMKATEIPRPWLPMAMALPLLSKAQGLNDVAGVFSDADLAVMGKAIGPLRVDWSFDEIDVDPLEETIIDNARYSADVSRPRKHVTDTRTAAKATHARLDISKTSVYTNCPEAPAGGIRPAATADYFKAAFGHGGADSLAPWHAEPDAGTETVVTIVHDNVGQADDKTHAGRFGQAGAYFRPSTMGGDGYRVRAQVRFKPTAGYQFDNLAVLERRYPLRPQVQSARLRVWRKASLRAYVNCAPVNNWAATRDDMARFFEAAYLHLEAENDQPIPGFSILDLMRNGSAFRSLVKESIPSGPTASKADLARAKKEHIALNGQRLWPWYGAPHFGLFESSSPGVAWGDAIQEFYDRFSMIFYSLSNLYGLDWVQTMEKRTGKLRGHTVVEFQCGDDFYAQEYECDACNTRYHYVERNASGDSRFREKCPAPGCNGKLGHVEKYLGQYRCASGHAVEYEESSDAGGDFIGAAHPGCGGALATVQQTRPEYACKKCGWTFAFADATGAAHEGDPCMNGTCAGKMHRAGGAGLFEETYTCRKCAANVTLAEGTAAGGSHADERHAGCAKLISGKLRRTAVAATPVSVGHAVRPGFASESGYKGLPVPSLGNPLGVSFNFDGTADLWAHELAHNRYMEHTGNAGGGAGAVPQHDTEPNTVFNFAGIGETDPVAMNWDRSCLMTYANQLPTYDAARERLCLCGKCTLKIRGWKVQPLANPAGNVHE